MHLTPLLRHAPIIERKDEIQEHIAARYISAPQAAWRIFGFSGHGMWPKVQRLHVHLPEEVNVVFDGDAAFEDLEEMVADQTEQVSTLLAYCQSNSLQELNFREFGRELIIWGQE
jgi:hypothetical protein